MGIESLVSLAFDSSYGREKPAGKATCIPSMVFRFGDKGDSLARGYLKGAEPLTKGGGSAAWSGGNGGAFC